MRILKSVVFALAATTMFSAPAGAAETIHANIQTIEIGDFIGTVNIETRARGDVRLDTRSGADASYPVMIDADNGVLTIRSDENPDETRWWDDVDWRRYEEKAFEEFLKDYPILTLTIPAGAALSFDSAVVKLTADNTSGALSVARGHVDGVIGDIASGMIKIHGSGDLRTGAVAGPLYIGIHGSGDFNATTAESLEAHIHGSGDIQIGDIAGGASAGINGSGDVDVGDIGGPFIASINGSGDIEAGKVRGGAATSINGSGDISIASVDGETTANIHGSGGIHIRDGRAENLRVVIKGSGDFELDGLATNPQIYADSSGDVFIRRHEGAIFTSGDGEIEISGVDYGDDD